jgi:hypothetical protein
LNKPPRRPRFRNACGLPARAILAVVIVRAVNAFKAGLSTGAGQSRAILQPNRLERSQTGEKPIAFARPDVARRFAIRELSSSGLPHEHA